MSDDEQWVDVTSLIEACAADLSHKDPFLCREESFSLHDSMAALELMDKKMDCCEIPAKHLPKDDNDEAPMIPPKPLPKSLDDEIHQLPWEELTLEDAYHICLEGLTRLESLLSGASMAESTYTCLYVHKGVLADIASQLGPDKSLTAKLGALLVGSGTTTSSDSSVQQHVVYACSLGLVELTDAIRSIVLHADIYEEEDFSVSNYGLASYREGEERETVAVLERTLDMLKEVESSKHSQALTFILSFQLNLLEACSVLAKLEARTVREQVHDASLAIQTAVAELVELQSRVGESDVTDPQILKHCFDPFLYRPLVGSAPIRKVMFRTPAESIGVLVQVTSELESSLCELLLLGTSLSRVRRILNRISEEKINILGRSLIVLNLYFEEQLLGQHGLSALVAQDMIEMSGIPVEHVTGSKHGQMFLNRLAKPVYDTLKLLVLNRNRQRSYMEGVMLHDWSSLQQEAHGVDAAQRNEFGTTNPFFTQYALWVTVRLMDHYVALGIELELFQGHYDLTMAFWYRDFLLSGELSQLLAMRTSRDKATRVNTNGHPGDKPVLHEDYEFIMVGFYRNLCRGIVRFLAALSQAKMVEVPTWHFTSHTARFHKRFEPFATIPQPPPLTFADFEQGSDFSSVTQEELLASAADSFKLAKNMLDKVSSNTSVINKDFCVIPESSLQGLTKICVGNSVFLMKLRQMVGKDGTASGSATFDFGNHQHFCTVRLS